VVILELIHAKNPDFLGRDVFIRLKTSPGQPGILVIHDNFSNRMALCLAMVHSNFCPINFRW
jgi:hypothetical protein